MFGNTFWWNDNIVGCIRFCRLVSLAIIILSIEQSPTHHPGSRWAAQPFQEIVSGEHARLPVEQIQSKFFSCQLMHEGSLRF